MKSKLFWSCCTVLVASLPTPSFAQTPPQVGFDYAGGSMKYQILPGKIPDRTLPKAFDFPIITNVATDTDPKRASNHPITDEFRAPATRTEYTRSLTTWSESIRECLGKQPLLIRTSKTDKKHKSPVQFNGKPGTIVRNVNNRAVCK